MNESTLIVAGCVLLVVLWAALFVYAARVCRSVFRYQLWRLRDEIVDQVFAGVLPHENSAVDVLLRSVEANIQGASEITMARWMIYPSPPEEWLRQREHKIDSGLKRLTPAEKQEWLRLYSQLRRGTMYLMCRSWSVRRSDGS